MRPGGVVRSRALAGAGTIVLALLVAGAVYAAGSARAGNGGRSSGSSTGAGPTAAVVHYRGSFALWPSHGVAGTEVRASGSGFRPGETLDVAWNTVQGRWKLAGASDESFMGRAFDPLVKPLRTVDADASGAFVTSFVAPDDFGFNHDVTVTAHGALVNKAAFRVDPTVTISPGSGPVGTPITVTMHGVGWQDMENSWELSYDDQFTGLLSSVTTGGIARAVIPATGAAGVHVLRVIHGSMTVPYLNMEQSPRPDRPTFTLRFAVTPGQAVLPEPVADQALAPMPGTRPGGGPALWVDPASATVGTPVTIHGAGMAPGAAVSLTWWTVVGSRVSGNGWDEQSTTLASAAAGPDGTFSIASVVPDDLGGAHRLEAVAAGRVVALTSLTITPSASPLSVSSGPAGTDVLIHLKGVGWTETANIYTLVYDNGYLGYACGFNSRGDVRIHLPAAGQPGWHFIDLYPAIYKGTDSQGTQDFRIPMLTFADHPGERLPAFRFAFLVTAAP